MRGLETFNGQCFVRGVASELHKGEHWGKSYRWGLGARRVRGERLRVGARMFVCVCGGFRRVR